MRLMATPTPSDAQAACVEQRASLREAQARKARYDGDLRSRDAAYHQGTVWAWLIAPFFDAWLRANPGDWKTARTLLAGFDAEMSEAGIGTISEIFDAEPPFSPRGCIAQAWSVAEVLRCELKLRIADRKWRPDGYWCRLAQHGIRLLPCENQTAPVPPDEGP
jgi:glycogen debranching enzyme